MSEFRYFTTQLYQSGSTPNPIIAEIPLTNVHFTQQLNSVGTFTGEILLSGVDVVAMNIIAGTQPGNTCLYVQFENNLVWGGVIWQREWDSSTQILHITAQEMLSYFQYRVISDNITYTNSDPCYIANDLIVTYAQSKSHGKIGIQAQSPLTTSTYQVTRSFFNFELKSIYQAVKDLSDGMDTATATPFFDYAIVPSYNGSNQIINTFVMGSPYIGDVTNVTAVFQLPGNIVEYVYPEDATAMANTVYGLGYGANALKLTATAKDNGTGGSISATGNAALIEKPVNFIDISDINLLKSITLGQLNAISQPPVTVQVVLPSYIDPYFGSGFKVGDFARLVFKDDRFPTGFDSIYRIVAIDAAPGDNAPDRITVTLTVPVVGTGTVS